MVLPRWQHTVLIVEDDRDLRGIFADWLTFAGFRVQQAGDGPEALRSIERDPPALLLLDLALPTLDGFAVRDEILAHVETWDIPIVIVTGLAEPFEKRLRGARVLQKPVMPERLVTTVCDALRASSYQRSFASSSGSRRSCSHVRDPRVVECRRAVDRRLVAVWLGYQIGSLGR